MKSLLILSGKGGTGKTTTAAAFIRFSQAKAIADCDVDAPNLHLIAKQMTEPEKSVFLGGEKAVINRTLCKSCGKCMEYCRFDAITNEDNMYKINEFTCEGCGVCAHVCPQKAIRLRVDIAGEKELYKNGSVFSTATLKMGRGNSGKLVTDVKMAMLNNAGDTDIAIVDGSPGIGCPVIASIGGMDMVLIVAEPSLSGISDLKRLVTTASNFDIDIAVCVNKWDISPENTQAIQDFCKEVNIPFIGKIPYDKMASEAINKGLSLADIDCPAQKALKEIYEKIIILINNQKE